MAGGGEKENRDRNLITITDSLQDSLVVFVHLSSQIQVVSLRNDVCFGLAVVLGRLDVVAEKRYGGVDEQLPHRHADPERLFHTTLKLGGQQRVSAETKNV